MEKEEQQLECTENLDQDFSRNFLPNESQRRRFFSPMVFSGCFPTYLRTTYVTRTTITLLSMVNILRKGGAIVTQ